MQTDAGKKRFRLYPVEPDTLKIDYIEESGLGGKVFTAKARESENDLERKSLKAKAT